MVGADDEGGVIGDLTPHFGAQTSSHSSDSGPPGPVIRVAEEKRPSVRRNDHILMIGGWGALKLVICTRDDRFSDTPAPRLADAASAVANRSTASR